MIGRTTTAMAGLLLFGACAHLGGEPLPPVDATLAPESLEFQSVSQSYDRAFEEAFTDAPFANGALAVIAPDGLGKVATYRLVPCRGGAAICAGGEGGAAGQLRRTPDWHVVTGLYGRTFWLSHGGDGYVERGGQYIPLAWNARPEGTGDGDAGSLETPFQHGHAVLEELGAAPLPVARTAAPAGGAFGAPPQPVGPGQPLILGTDIE